MALPTTGLTGFLDARTSAALWKEVGKTTHPVDGERTAVWDDPDRGFGFYNNTGSVTTYPIWRATGIDGEGALEFDNTDGVVEFLIARNDANSADYALSNFITVSAYTIFVEAYFIGASANSSTFTASGLFSTSAQNFGCFGKTVTGVHSGFALNFDGGYDVTSGLAFALNTKVVLMFQHLGGNIVCDLDDSGSPQVVASGNTAGGGALNGFVCIGGNVTTGAAGLKARVSRSAIYNVGLAGADLSDAWAYFLGGGGAGGGGGERPVIGEPRVGYPRLGTSWM